MKHPEQNEIERCPECGALWKDGLTCQDAFYQMLYWENENLGYGVVHHLTVLSYYLQHPSLYSPEGLVYSRSLLIDFVERGMDPAVVRHERRDEVDSTHRTWKISGSEGGRGSYTYPVEWSITGVIVVQRGVEHYIQSVRDWAASIYQDLKSSGNLT